MRERYQDDIAPVVVDRWAAEKSEGSNVQTKKEPNGPFCAAIARELFAALPEEERDGYRVRAKEEAQEARAVYDKGLKDPASKAPEARQK
jgi:hypothetical protein